MIRIRLGTRGSALALAQARQVAARIAALDPEAEVEIVVVRTAGDRSQASLRDLPGVGLFTRELEEALLAGEVDIAVHSLKDLPTLEQPGLEVVAILEREDPRDAILSREGQGLAALPRGALVATSSPRRRAQLARARPDLRFTEVRGNVDTRIRKLKEGQFDATLLALAGLKRLGLAGEASEVAGLDVLLPAPGQAAIAVEARAGSVAGALACRLDHPETRAAVEAERALLLALGGGCSLPLGALGRLGAEAGAAPGEMVLEAVVAGPGGDLVRARERGPAREGRRLGLALARRLRELGGPKLLGEELARGPLAGKRVLVSAQSATASRLEGVLAALGAAVACLPAIEIVPPEDPAPLRRAARGAKGFDWIAFTSANGVWAFLEALEGEGAEPLGKQPWLAAVGPGTAQALRERGLEPRVVAERTSGRGLAEALAGAVEPGARVLLPRAAGASPDVPALLGRQGARVEEVEAYRSVAPPELAAGLAEVLAGEPLDAVVHASPSALRNLLGAAAGGEGALGERLRAIPCVACIGPVTAAAAREAGLEVAACPARSTPEDLAIALVQHYARAALPGP